MNDAVGGNHDISCYFLFSCAVVWKGRLEVALSRRVEPAGIRKQLMRTLPTQSTKHVLCTVRITTTAYALVFASSPAI